MSVDRILHHFPLDPASRLARLVLGEKRLPFADVSVRYWERPPELTRLNPSGLVPVLVETAEGRPPLVLCESRAIVDHLEEAYADPALLRTSGGGRVGTGSDAGRDPGSRLQCFARLRRRWPREQRQRRLLDGDGGLLDRGGVLGLFDDENLRAIAIGIAADRARVRLGDMRTDRALLDAAAHVGDGEAGPGHEPDVDAPVAGHPVAVVRDGDDHRSGAEVVHGERQGLAVPAAERGGVDQDVEAGGVEIGEGDVEETIEPLEKWEIYSQSRLTINLFRHTDEPADSPRVSSRSQSP